MREKRDRGRIAQEMVMKLTTKVFELCNGKYRSLSELARAMGISTSHIYRVRQGKRHINERFTIGAIRAFPEYELSDLFCSREEPE